MEKDIDLTIIEIENLAAKIKKGTATLLDYEKHEKLLLENGFNEFEVREDMLKYGFTNFEDYLEARKAPADKQQQKVVNVYIVAFFLALGLVAILLRTKKTVRASTNF